MIKTNPNFWDCECEYGYVHPKSLKVCPICGADSENSPDSREDEIDGYILDKVFG